MVSTSSKLPSEIFNNDKPDGFQDFFGDQCYTPEPQSMVNLALDENPEEQSTGSSPVKVGANTYVHESGSSGKRSSSAMYGARRKKRSLAKEMSNERFDRVMSVVETHYSQKQEQIIGAQYQEVMAALLALNVEDNALLYYAMDLFNAETHRHMFLACPKELRLGYIKSIYDKHNN